MRFPFLAAFLFWGAVSQAMSGALLVNETTYGSRQVVRSTTLVGTNAVRVDVVGDQKNNTVIYRTDKRCFYMVNTKNKSYTEVTKERMEALAAQMDADMKRLPPSMREMMAGKLGVPPNAAPRYVKKARGEKVGKWTTTRYEAQDKKSVRKMWTVPPSAVSLTASDLAALKDFGAFFERFGTNRGDYFKFDRSDLGFAGIPVKTVLMEGGKVQVTSELKDAVKKDFPASTFEAPKGFKRKTLETE